MTELEDLVKRLRAESLQGYSPRVHTQFPEAINTLAFFTVVFAQRADTIQLLLPIELIQQICSLGVVAFEVASGDKVCNSDYFDGRLDKIWYLFTLTLARWVQRERKPANNWYSCFEVPDWFVKGAMDLGRVQLFDN